VLNTVYKTVRLLSAAMAFALLLTLNLSGLAKSAEDFIYADIYAGDFEQMKKDALEQANAFTTNKERNFDGAYKTYSFICHTWLYDYEKDGVISDKISTKYFWRVPTEDGLGLYTYVPEGDGWSVVDFTDYTNAAGKDFIEKQNLQNDMGDRLKGIVQLKYIYEPRIYTTFVYIQTNDDEYFIPYAGRPEFVNLENGRVYTVKEAVERLKASAVYTTPGSSEPEPDGGEPDSGDSEPDPGGGEPDSGGGGGLVPDADAGGGPFSFRLIVLCVSGGIIVLAAGYILLSKRKNKTAL
jgi:hypothetical protein